MSTKTHMLSNIYDAAYKHVLIYSYMQTLMQYKKEHLSPSFTSDSSSLLLSSSDSEEFSFSAPGFSSC